MCSVGFFLAAVALEVSQVAPFPIATRVPLHPPAFPLAASRMGKILKSGKVVIVLRGRYAGRKAVVVKAFDDPTKDRKFAHCTLVRLGVRREEDAVQHRAACGGHARSGAMRAVRSAEAMPAGCAQALAPPGSSPLLLANEPPRPRPRLPRPLSAGRSARGAAQDDQGDVREEEGEAHAVHAFCQATEL